MKLHTTGDEVWTQEIIYRCHKNDEENEKDDSGDDVFFDQNDIKNSGDPDEGRQAQKGHQESHETEQKGVGDTRKEEANRDHNGLVQAGADHSEEDGVGCVHKATKYFFLGVLRKRDELAHNSDEVRAIPERKKHREQKDEEIECKSGKGKERGASNLENELRDRFNEVSNLVGQLVGGNPDGLEQFLDGGGFAEVSGEGLGGGPGDGADMVEKRGCFGDNGENAQDKRANQNEADKKGQEQARRIAGKPEFVVNPLEGGIEGESKDATEKKGFKQERNDLNREVRDSDETEDKKSGE